METTQSILIQETSDFSHTDHRLLEFFQGNISDVADAGIGVDERGDTVTPSTAADYRPPKKRHCYRNRLRQHKSMGYGRKFIAIKAKLGSTLRNVYRSATDAACIPRCSLTLNNNRKPTTKNVNVANNAALWLPPVAKFTKP